MKYFIVRSVFVLSLCAILTPAQSRDEITEKHLQPLITTSELVIGTNRFAFGLLKGNKLLNDAEVALKVYAIDGSEASVMAELKVPYLKARNVKQEHTAHRHADGTEHVHGDESDIDGLYVTHLSFSRAGDWRNRVAHQARNRSGGKARFCGDSIKSPVDSSHRFSGTIKPQSYRFRCEGLA